MRAALLVLAIGCGGGGGSSNVDAPITIDAAPDSGGGCVPARTIFLNRNGGTYMPGTDDATTNKTPILSAQTTIPAPAITDPDWLNVTTCVRAKLAGYKVDIRDTDVAAPHIEIVVIDNGTQINMPGLVNTAVPSPCAGGGGTALTNTVAFV